MATTPSDEQIAAVDFKYDQQEACKLDAGCVRIEPVEPKYCDGPICEEKTPVTKAVWIELLNNGQDMAIEEFCDICAEDFAKALRESLPEEPAE